MAIDSKNLLVWVKAMSRGQALPLDASEVHESLAAAQAYAATATAYAGQSVKAKGEDGKYHEYILQPTEAGYVLEEVGAIKEEDLKQYVQVVDELPTAQKAVEGVLYINGTSGYVYTPGVTSFDNELGGTAVVFSGTTAFEYKYYVCFGFLNETRKSQLIDILTEFAALPIYYPGDEEMLFKAAKTPDGNLFAIALNLSLDEVEKAKFVIERDVKSIKRIMKDGTYENVEFKRNGNEYTLNLALKVFDPVALIINQ
jgi:hypothetical protein